MQRTGANVWARFLILAGRVGSDWLTTGKLRSKGGLGETSIAITSFENKISRCRRWASSRVYAAALFHPRRYQGDGSSHQARRSSWCRRLQWVSCNSRRQAPWMLCDETSFPTHFLLSNVNSCSTLPAVLDLRNNPGGVFEEAVAMAVRFLVSASLCCPKFASTRGVAFNVVKTNSHFDCSVIIEQWLTSLPFFGPRHCG